MTLALIPARGGSKGIPRKNIREIAGKPLIAWTIEAALGAKGIDRVVVSTEDEEIAEVARAWGADVPFMRPADLASDEAPGISPVMHAIEQLPDHDALHGKVAAAHGKSALERILLCPMADVLPFWKSIGLRTLKRGELKQNFQLTRNGLVSITPRVPA